MRISDWSSDVCSSDLPPRAAAERYCRTRKGAAPAGNPGTPRQSADGSPATSFGGASPHLRSEERRVGKECVIRVDLGGRRIIKKKKERHNEKTSTRNKTQVVNTNMHLEA